MSDRIFFVKYHIVYREDTGESLKIAEIVDTINQKSYFCGDNGSLHISDCIPDIKTTNPIPGALFLGFSLQEAINNYKKKQEDVFDIIIQKHPILSAITSLGRISLFLTAAVIAGVITLIIYLL